MSVSHNYLPFVATTAGVYLVVAESGESIDPLRWLLDATVELNLPFAVVGTSTYFLELTIIHLAFAIVVLCPSIVVVCHEVELLLKGAVLFPSAAVTL